MNIGEERKKEKANRKTKENMHGWMKWHVFRNFYKLLRELALTIDFLLYFIIIKVEIKF
jgi:hypothetical protein